MDRLIDFIIVHWYAIASLCLTLISLIIVVCKKPKKNKQDDDSIFTLMMEYLPKVINKVENPGYGESKKELVIKYTLQYIGELFNRELTEAEVVKWSKIISNQVELFLSTPSKKGNL